MSDASDDADIPPDMPELDDQLLDELSSLEDSDLADAGPPPALVPPPPPVPSGKVVAAPPPKTTTRTGATLNTPVGRFLVIRRLAAGGMGEVFQARKLGSASFNKDVALKRILTSLRMDDVHRKEFVDEARLAALLNHRNIAQVFDLVELESSYLLVMEYLPGLNIRELLLLAQAKGASLSEPFALYIAAEVADALAYAHTLQVDGKPMGIVHRDVSPHNVMVTESGTIKLLDFGVAYSHLEGRDQTRTGFVKGKLSYMSPEQASDGELDGRSDQFSLAIVVVEMLTGRRIFDAPSKSKKTGTNTLVRIATCSPELIAQGLEGIAAPLTTILSQALSREPAQRYPTCLHFAEALRDHLLAQKIRFGPAQALEEIARLRALPDQESSAFAAPASPPPPPAATPPSPAANAPSGSLSISVSAPTTPAEAPEPSSSVPGPTTVQRRKRTLDQLYQPPAAKRSGFVLPLAAFAVLLVIGVGIVRVITSSSAPPPAAVEVLKTPAQQRAERELEEKQLVAPSVTPPTLSDAPAPAQPTPEPSQPTALGAPASLATATPPAARTKPRRAPATPAAAAPPEATAQAAPPPGPPLRSLSFRSSLGASTAAPAASSSATSDGLGLPRGTQLAARLEGVADPSNPGPVTAVLTRPVQVSGRTVLPQGARIVCDVGAVSGSRLAVSCDSLTVDGVSRAFSGLAYAQDGRPGLPVTTTGGSESVAANAAVGTSERLTRTLRPGGAVGEVVDGVTEAVGRSARRAAASPTTTSVIPKGTLISVFCTQPL